MRQGVFIIRGENATVRRQSQACLVLSHSGWSCQAQSRFDGVLIVSMKRDDGEPDSSLEEVRTLLDEGGVFLEVDSELKEIPAAE
jgi:hypothetical protein